MKLYEINAEIQHLSDQIEFDKETVELLGDSDELFTQLNTLEMEKVSILSWLTKLVLNLRSENRGSKT